MRAARIRLGRIVCAQKRGGLLAGVSREILHKESVGGRGWLSRVHTTSCILYHVPSVRVKTCGGYQNVT